MPGKYPLRFEAAEDSAGSDLHKVRAVFEQLGHTLRSYCHPVMEFFGFGDGISITFLLSTSNPLKKLLFENPKP